MGLPQKASVLHKPACQLHGLLEGASLPLSGSRLVGVLKRLTKAVLFFPVLREPQSGCLPFGFKPAEKATIKKDALQRPNKIWEGIFGGCSGAGQMDLGFLELRGSLCSGFTICFNHPDESFLLKSLRSCYWLNLLCRSRDPKALGNDWNFVQRLFLRGPKVEIILVLFSQPRKRGVQPKKKGHPALAKPPMTAGPLWTVSLAVPGQGNIPSFRSRLAPQKAPRLWALGEQGGGQTPCSPAQIRSRVG